MSDAMMLQQQMLRDAMARNHGGGGASPVTAVLPQKNVMDGVVDLAAPFSSFQSLTEQKSLLDEDFIEWMCGRLNINAQKPGVVLKLLQLFGFDLRQLKFTSELGGLHEAAMDHGPSLGSGGHGLGSESAIDHSKGGSAISYDH